MALRQVGARIEGDVFQGMFFWWNAAKLLRPSSRVVRVTIENDVAAGVDDVSVNYADPGINAGGRSCAADYFQVKYHVAQSAEYAAESFCDPSFINSAHSLLQRFLDAYSRLSGGNGWYRLHLISNWRWSATDQLSPLLRVSDEGALPDRFFTAGPCSDLGKIREKWRDHLGLSEEVFEDFARRLRLRVDFLSRGEFRECLNERLINVGMREIPVDKTQNVYDTLTQQLIMNRTNSFDPQTFRDYCKREDLLVSPPSSGAPVLGIRSFMRCAERMEDECSSFVCVAKFFEGRHIREADAWQNAVLPEVVSFLAESPSLRTGESHLLLECHSSIAFLAGYELDRKSGAQVFPVQKGVRKSLWKPGASPNTARSEWMTTTTASGSGDDVAVVVSVSRDALADAKGYADGVSTIGKVVDVRPASGVGSRVVENADHAVALADNLAEVIRTHRPKNGGTAHLFIAAPNALTFFLGQHRGALGKVLLYEFDFEGEQGGSYSPSIRLPA